MSASHPIDNFSVNVKICYGMCSCICHTKIVMGYSLTLTKKGLLEKSSALKTGYVEKRGHSELRELK